MQKMNDLDGPNDEKLISIRKCLLSEEMSGIDLLKVTERKWMEFKEKYGTEGEALAYIKNIDERLASIERIHEMCCKTYKRFKDNYRQYRAYCKKLPPHKRVKIQKLFDKVESSFDELFKLRVKLRSELMTIHRNLLEITENNKKLDILEAKIRVGNEVLKLLDQEPLKEKVIYLRSEMETLRMNEEAKMKKIIKELHVQRNVARKKLKNFHPQCESPLLKVLKKDILKMKDGFDVNPIRSVLTEQEKEEFDEIINDILKHERRIKQYETRNTTVDNMDTLDNLALTIEEKEQYRTYRQKYEKVHKEVTCIILEHKELEEKFRRTCEHSTTMVSSSDKIAMNYQNLIKECSLDVNCLMAELDNKY